MKPGAVVPRGGHRAPTPRSATAAKVAVGGLVLVESTGGFPRRRRSRRNPPIDQLGADHRVRVRWKPRATNSSSTASRLVQFLDSSWKAYGGGQFSTRARQGGHGGAEDAGRRGHLPAVRADALDRVARLLVCGSASMAVSPREESMSSVRMRAHDSSHVHGDHPSRAPLDRGGPAHTSTVLRQRR
jgi:hypothetical protein